MTIGRLLKYFLLPAALAALLAVSAAAVPQNVIRQTTPTKEWFEKMRAGDIATPTDATATDGRPVESLWDLVPGNTPLYPAAPIPVCGDLDGSGTLEPADARLALRFAIGLEPVLEADKMLWLADADGDGKADPADARLILRAAVGLTNFRLPDPTWDVYRLRAFGVGYEYAQLGALKVLETNGDKVSDFKGEHLPLWRIDSGEALARWLDAFEKTDQRVEILYDSLGGLPDADGKALHDGKQPQTVLTDPSVPALLKRYGDAFFAEYDLLICNKNEGSGGYRQAMYRPEVKDGGLTLTVCTAYNPEYGYTADLGCWFIFAPVPKTLTAQCRTFDCLKGETVLFDRSPDVVTEGGITNWAYAYDNLLTEDVNATITKGEDYSFPFSLMNCQDGGYLWVCDSDGGAALKGPYYVTYPDPRLAGSPSLQTYSVMPEKQGTYTLHFSLKRSWETESIDERIVTVTVR